MATMKKAQLGGLFRKGAKAVEKTAPKASKKLDGKLIKQAITKIERADLKKKMRGWDKEMGSQKNGGSMKKAKSGTSLGMKSVKAGFDKNPGVTRADIITAAKGKAKSGTKMKKAMMGSSMAKPMMKSGGKMTKCKYGCK